MLMITQVTVQVMPGMMGIQLRSVEQKVDPRILHFLLLYIMNMVIILYQWQVVVKVSMEKEWVM